MRNICSFILFLCLSGISMANAQHQKINCDSLCVTNFELTGINNDTLKITLYNGDSQHINYPILKVIYQGDTVAIQKDMNYYAQMGKSSLVHYIPTTLSAIPLEFICKVVVIDPLWKDTCIINYPCGTLNSVAYKASLKNAFHVYPNPASESLYMSFAKLNPSKTMHIKVYSVLGKQVLEANISAENNYSLNVSKLDAGTYFIKAFSANNVYVKQFLKN